MEASYPAMPILVGAASRTDKTLIDCGRCYPKEAQTPEARLRYYSSIFPLVEVDSSYYGIPTPTNASNWAERTPEGFVFNVKAFRLFTGHQTDPKVLHKDIEQALGTNAAPASAHGYAGIPNVLRNDGEVRWKHRKCAAGAGPTAKRIERTILLLAGTFVALGKEKCHSFRWQIIKAMPARQAYRRRWIGVLPPERRRRFARGARDPVGPLAGVSGRGQRGHTDQSRRGAHRVGTC
jgi:hypothetical protein